MTRPTPKFSLFPPPPPPRPAPPPTPPYPTAIRGQQGDSLREEAKRLEATSWTPAARHAQALRHFAADLFSKAALPATDTPTTPPNAPTQKAPSTVCNPDPTQNPLGKRLAANPANSPQGKRMAESHTYHQSDDDSPDQPDAAMDDAPASGNYTDPPQPDPAGDLPSSATCSLSQ